jgi:copper chaperone CopZ
MIRRQFLQLLTAAGAGGLAPLKAFAAARKTLTYRVKGFTCITCATGLDTLLGQQKGIVSSKSTYPEGQVTVVYDPGATSPESIRGFIAELGFRVES